MKCYVCSSDDTHETRRILTEENKGYAEFTCSDCKSVSRYFFEIESWDWTDEFDVFPFEEE